MTAEMSVTQALSAVMEDVQAVKKAQKNQQQGYSFRGIDSVMNAVGPVLRKHSVVIVPESVETHYRDAMTTTGKPAREVTVLVTYRAYGPAGDSITIQSAGESLDSGDKGTPKAMSVAYRTALLQALTIPTDEPDPDSFSYERALSEPARPKPGPQSDAQRKRMHALLGELGLDDREKYVKLASWHAHREVASTSDLDTAEAAAFIDYLSERRAKEKAAGAPNIPAASVPGGTE